MSADRSRERKRLAAEFIASILALARKWLDLAERGSSQQEALDRAACLHDIQTKIGQELRATYDLPQHLPRRMLMLLMQLNDQQEGEQDGATETAS